MLAIGNADLMNDQGKAMGFKTDDILVKINGEAIPEYGPGMGAFIGKQQQGLEDGKTLSYTVLRKNEAGEQKEVELKAPVKKIEIKKKFIMSFSKDATPEQLALRESWISIKK